MESTATTPEKSQKKLASDKFVGFEIKNGKFIAFLDGRKYEIKEILHKGNGETWVTYYDDGVEKDFLQLAKKIYRNDRIYGEEVEY